MPRFGSDQSESVLPVIPTSLAEVEVVQRWRDGVPAALPVFSASSSENSAADSAPTPGGGSRTRDDLAAVAQTLGMDPDLLEFLGVSSRPGSVQAVPAVPVSAGREEPPAWTVGVGAGEPEQWRQAGAGLARAVDQRLSGIADASSGEPGDPSDLGEALDADYVQLPLPASVVGSATAEDDATTAESDPADIVRNLTLGLLLGGYRFRLSRESSPPQLRKALLIAPPGADVAVLRQAVQQASEWAQATALTRDLANVPSNIKNPSWLADQAVELTREIPGLQCSIRDEKWLAQKGFGGVLAVGSGSVSPPRLIELAWRPDLASGKSTADLPHLVLVGKGITFDTGGISIKPADGMHLMRTDMAGGAAVIAAVRAIARLQLPVRVTALVPAAENHVSGSSYRPGDVVRHYGGTTSEITNTDAEGRLVLADALAYAVRSHQPDALVDVATLTGAMKVALGMRTGGVFGSDDALRAGVVEAGQATGETWWPMPLPEDYVDDIRSDQADLHQAPAGPGAITAALFLREFTSGLPWAHLDIAGPARTDKAYAEVTPPASGFAARTLIELVAGFRGWSPSGT